MSTEHVHVSAKEMEEVYQEIHEVEEIEIETQDPYLYPIGEENPYTLPTMLEEYIKEPVNGPNDLYHNVFNDILFGIREPPPQYNYSSAHLGTPIEFLDRALRETDEVKKESRQLKERVRQPEKEKEKKNKRTYKKKE
ncbi:hypothetical protein L1987_46658 [Smallanthus sonchifolius]|uniref:Uncharacterized protein n=1 Tax=Smallanthus sonchifolius TaxID=185202 RepID=A0ACB9G1F4_9ASTR|nr:hypothetical protein L1987_46658 [Smallanthus sonchifolius]